MSLKNDRLLKALQRQPVDRPPVWLLRQAGRYLPEYRALRAKSTDFLSFCKTPAMAAEATFQPLSRFDFDASIIFSDILTIPDAMGAAVRFVEGEGPQIIHPIRDASALARLRVAQPEKDLAYVLEAIERVKSKISVPLIGFCGSPWTLACYMVEGAGSKSFSETKKWMYTDPKGFSALLDLVAESVTQHLRAQIEAGVDVVMLFDTWGGLLSTKDYLKYSLGYMKKILDALPTEYRGRRIPRILFTKGGGGWLKSISMTGCDAIALDWTVDLTAAREQVGDKVALQGNLDPILLEQANPSVVRESVFSMLDAYGSGPGHIVNLGHGILPQTPIENVEALIAAVKEYQHHG